MEKNLKNTNNKDVQGTNKLFTKREWILRYSSPLKSLLFMAIPMVIITLVNSAYGIIDKQLTLHYAIGDVEKLLKANGGPFAEINEDGSIISGKTNINDFAMQIINISTQYSNTIIFLLNALSIFTCVGTAIKWGQAMGRRDKKEMDAVLVNGVIQTIILSVIGVLVLHYSEDFILTSQANIPNNNTKEQAIQYILAHDYTDIFILGFPLLIFATFLSTMLRTEGKVWWIIGINLSSIIVNILLGIIIMTNAPEGEKMKAAVYSSMVAWVFIIFCDLLVITFSKNTYLKPQLKNMRLRFQDSRDAWLFGLSPFISNTVFAVANYVLTLLVTTMHSQEVANHIVGTIRIGAFDQAGNPLSKLYITPALRVLSAGAPWSQVLWAPVIGMMQGSNANYAYSKGAGKRFRIFEMWRFQIIIVMTWTIIVEILLLSFGGQMLGIFAGPKDKGIWLFYYMSCFILFAFTVSVMSLFQGIGSAKRATALSLVRSLVCTMSFSLIGWAIAKYGIKNDDGEGDKWIFVFYGWSEIPAFIAAFIIVSNLGRKIIKNNQMNDHKDEFTPPSYLKAILNEIEISRASKIHHCDEILQHKINKINILISKNKSNSNYSKKIELLKDQNAKKIKKINIIMDNKLSKAKIKHAHQDYPITTNKLQDNLNIIQSKYDVRKEHIQSLSVSESSKNKALDLLTKKYNKNKISAMKKQDLTDQKIEKFKNGSKKLTLFNLITIYSEPQPINE